jgi:hypothetical protein
MDRRPTARARKSTCAPVRRSRSVPRHARHVRFLSGSVRSRSIPSPSHSDESDGEMPSNIPSLYTSNRRSFLAARSVVENSEMEPYVPFNRVLHMGDSDALSGSDHERSPEPLSPRVPIDRRSALSPYTTWDRMRKEASTALRTHRFFMANLVGLAIWLFP